MISDLLNKIKELQNKFWYKWVVLRKFIICIEMYNYKKYNMTTCSSTDMQYS